MLPFTMGGNTFESVFLVTQQLRNKCILVLTYGYFVVTGIGMEEPASFMTCDLKTRALFQEVETVRYISTNDLT
jgi:hypothetical protein